jgi:polar amino acid transport system substrate-binding protein
MNFSKRLLLAAAAALALSATAAQADLKFGVDAGPYPPFTSMNAAGAWEGWEVDFMQALCAELGETKCEFVPVAWDGIIPALTSKKFDGILSSMSITPERRKAISYSIMYYNSAAVIIGNKDGDMDFSPEHLTGKTIGVQGATVHAAYIEKYYTPKGVTVKTYGKQDEANADLAAGRLDYVMADGVTLGSFLDAEEGKACCEPKGAVPYDASILGEGVGIGVRQEDTAFAEKLNVAIKALAARGFFEEITKKWKLEGKLILPSKS